MQTTSKLWIPALVVVVMSALGGLVFAVTGGGGAARASAAPTAPIAPIEVAPVEHPEGVECTALACQLPPTPAVDDCDAGAC